MSHFLISSAQVMRAMFFGATTSVWPGRRIFDSAERVTRVLPPPMVKKIPEQGRSIMNLRT